ncbi:uncharacterized protein [Euwallacea similis]|uniref:uncharacterized protein n=1 Tax=Euwallacea similis TaxID=1736056 RepID=UPI00344EE23A
MRDVSGQLMESSLHWRTKTVICTVCCRILDHDVPVLHCSLKHPLCQNCYNEIRLARRDYNLQLICPLCKISGQLMENRDDNLSIAKIKSRISRPYHSTTLPVTQFSYSKNYRYFCAPSVSLIENTEDEEKIFETLIGMSKEKFYQYQKAYKHSVSALHQKQQADKKCQSFPQKSRFSLAPCSATKRPFKCPLCHKTVAVAQLVNHFKFEHKQVENCTVERGKELLLSCDVSLIEYNFPHCLAMITVYEINRIDYVNSGSPKSIIKTCSKFRQRIPISTFWLMATGSPQRKNSLANCVFRLFTNSDEAHKCTIELGSKHDSVSLSTYCGVSKVLEKDLTNVNKFQGLVVTKSSFSCLLKEGAVLNLRITVH